MKRSLRITLAIAALLAAFGAGYKLRPRLRAEHLYTVYAKYIRSQPNHKQVLEHGTIDTVARTDYRRLTAIASPADAEAKRQAMAEYIFSGQRDALTRLPDEVEQDVLYPPLADLQLSSIDRLTVRMPYGVVSEVYYLKASQRNHCLMVYQEGHQVSFLERKRFLDRISAEGCDVLALSLPLTGADNSRPEIDHPRVGRILLNDPDDLQLLDSASYSSLAFFFTPLVAALNHALTEETYDKVGATGFSGGGWAVEVLAALDPRISATYSVAGSVPEAVHAAEPGWGSPEQRQGRFYDIANYTEIYVMAADRPGRRHVQFYNETDPCCFSGRLWLAWKDPVAEKARALGGEYKLFSYVSKQHTMTKGVALTIVDDFLRDGRSVPTDVTER
ncbi:MAG TPA: hypothetical protein VL974_03520 [Magnetospirillum sp.]|jgi:hypothetical protein|nr:hypothetical protein [Magnetospirillum sp.]